MGLLSGQINFRIDMATLRLLVANAINAEGEFRHIKPEELQIGHHMREEGQRDPHQVFDGLDVTVVRKP